MAFECTSCLAGTYQPFEAATPDDAGTTTGTGCFLCPAGFYCPDDGMGPKDAQPIDCPPGYYCEEGTVTYSSKCPDGYYSSMNNLREESQCWLCKEGHYCSNIADSAGVNSSVTGECDAGYYCIYGATESAPALLVSDTKLNGPCPAYHFCIPASGYGIPCLPGTYDSSNSTPN
jgi:hypothetical protein